LGEPPKAGASDFSFRFRLHEFAKLEVANCNLKLRTRRLTLVSTGLSRAKAIEAATETQHGIQ